VISILDHANRQQQIVNDQTVRALEQKNQVTTAQHARGVENSVPIDIAHSIREVAETIATIVKPNVPVPGSDMYSSVFPPYTDANYPASLYGSRNDSVADMNVNRQYLEGQISHVASFTNVDTPDSNISNYTHPQNLLESMGRNPLYLQGLHSADTLSSRTNSLLPDRNLIYFSNHSSPLVSDSTQTAAFASHPRALGRPQVLPTRPFTSNTPGHFASR